VKVVEARVAGPHPALDDRDRHLVKDALRRRRPVADTPDALQHQRAPIADRVCRPERADVIRWRHERTLAVAATPPGRAVPDRDRAAGSVTALKFDWHWTSPEHRLQQPEHTGVSASAGHLAEESTDLGR
jgi:hypothetical protein